MRKTFSGVLYTYIDWLRSPRQFLFIAEIILILQFIISPVADYALEEGLPLNVFEPFLLLFSESIFVVIIFFVFFLLVSDFPKILPAHVYIIPRIGRVKWFTGQLIFAIMSAATYFGVLFLTCALYVVNNAYFANGWSPAYQKMVYEANTLAQKQAFILLPSVDLLYSSRPYDALPNTFALLMLMSVFFMLIICVCTLKKRKFAGVIISMGLLGVGFALMNARSAFRWVFPLSNGILRDHFIRLITVYPILSSYIYFSALVVIGTVLCFRLVKRYSFSFSLED